MQCQEAVKPHLWRLRSRGRSWRGTPKWNSGHSGSPYHSGAVGGLEVKSETQWHHGSPVQLPNPMSTTSQNHSATTGLLPRNIPTGKIKRLSNNFPLMTNFPKCWLAYLPRAHSIFQLPIPKLLSLTKNSPKDRPSRCFQRGAQTPLWVSPSFPLLLINRRVI